MPRPCPLFPLHKCRIDILYQEIRFNDLYILNPFRGQVGILVINLDKRVSYGPDITPLHGRKHRIHFIIIGFDLHGVCKRIMTGHIPNKKLGRFQFQCVPMVMPQHFFQLRTVFPGQIQCIFQSLVIFL